VKAFDNPRWTIPVELTTTQYGVGTLKSVKIKDTFRLYAVAWDGDRYYPIASINWGTDIEFTANPGPRPSGQAPNGQMTGRLVWADVQWSSAVGQQPIYTGRRVNEVLVDTFVAA
jgi:hypothetical protein